MTQEALKLAIQLRDTASGYWTENEIPIIEKLIELLAQTQEPQIAFNAEVVGYVAPQRTEQELAEHWSDCAVHSEPAYPKGECNCGGVNPVGPNIQWKPLKPPRHSGQEHMTAKKYLQILYSRLWNQKKPWVGLTIEEIAACCRESTTTQLSFYNAIEAKLKEKNT